ncbi:MAG: hypothetical protein QOH50_863 [Kribbellaceae bacterium]|jgi:transcriptional regulator with XRE-family HTH domain|nr:hypothetical protein [Kribbellaceae bacterium]
MAGEGGPNRRLAAARRALGLTQAGTAARISQRLGLDPPIDGNYLSKLERGVHTWPNAEYRKALREVLGVGTDAELGFYCSRSAPEEDTTNVDRRRFFALTPAVASGLAITGPVAEFLARAEPPGRPPQLVGRSDVNHIVQSTKAFTEWDYRVGGELSVQAVSGQLRWAASLLEARIVQTDVRDDLHSAVGNLAQVAAWMSVDGGAHESAQRYFRFGLHCAEQARNAGLRAIMLSDMSRQLFHLGCYQEALSLIELAHVRADRLTGAERSMLSVVRSRPLAKLGRTSDTHAAIDHAKEQFAHHDPQQPPAPWMDFYDRAELAGDAGHSLFDIAVTGGQPEPALDQLGFAATSHTDAYARSRAFCQLKIATLWMKIDPSIAVTHANRAVMIAEPLRSGRIRGYLRELYTATRPHARLRDVAELRHSISRLTQVPA